MNVGVAIQETVINLGDHGEWDTEPTKIRGQGAGAIDECTHSAGAKVEQRTAAEPPDHLTLAKLVEGETFLFEQRLKVQRRAAAHDHVRSVFTFGESGELQGVRTDRRVGDLQTHARVTPGCVLNAQQGSVGLRVELGSWVVRCE
jgi:hypothetical protein